MYRILLVLLVSLGIVAGCGKPKEAQDPADIISDDSEHGGIEASGAPGPQPDATAHRRDVEPLATRDECAAAAVHLESLGIDLAIQSEPNEKKRAELEKHKSDALADPEVKARADKATTDCLERHTTKKEAACIAGVSSEDDIDKCVGEPSGAQH